MTKLQGFCSKDAARFAINDPWLQVKDGNLFLCATDGHILVLVEMLEYRKQFKGTSSFDNKTIGFPHSILGKDQLVIIQDGKWIREATGDTSQKPDVWKVIPKYANKKAEVPFTLNANYMAKSCLLVASMFGKGTPAEFMAKEALLPMTITHENDQWRLLIVLMPMRG